MPIVIDQIDTRIEEAPPPAPPSADGDGDVPHAAIVREVLRALRVEAARRARLAAD